MGTYENAIATLGVSTSANSGGGIEYYIDKEWYLERGSSL
jgi:hypothetical protein